MPGPRRAAPGAAPHPLPSEPPVGPPPPPAPDRGALRPRPRPSSSPHRRPGIAPRGYGTEVQSTCRHSLPPPPDRFQPMPCSRPGLALRMYECPALPTSDVELPATAVGPDGVADPCGGASG
ncbi:hypothetical protein Purlil1_10914 [Purpureocillium lilacinum]|uniref:Uncharacterized protein n=1 Tax=Purpureocillium lilacinum TaxID=33203 RepID=A0ABR0BL00_PURLI|nr:hypothetical protein Purlil1_10914 [Purpureocillium lilacinum]